MTRPSLQFGATLLLVLKVLPCLSATSSCDPACQFTIPVGNETDCRVYGGSASSGVVPYYRANASCLEAYNVSETRLDLDALLVTCPNADGTGADPVRLLTLLRGNNPSNTGSGSDGSLQQFGNRSEAEADYVKALFPTFFEHNNATGHFQLKTNVTDRLGQTVDCTQSVALCWEVINIYLSTNSDGEGLLVEVCQALRYRFRKQSEREQSEIRLVLCGEASSNAMCQPLASQVQSVAANSTTCDDIATPARLSQIPAECHPGKGGTGQDAGAGTSGSSRMVSRLGALMIGAVMLLLGL